MRVCSVGCSLVDVLRLTEEHQLQYSPMSVEKQVAMIYLGTQGLLREVAVKNVKAFEEHFLMELENKHPETLVEFKKGNLSDDGIAKVTELAKGLTAQYK